ncbi:FHA domain-containing protein [Demequina sp. NBRC 110053]|uniref:FHA domain-containing protein n=1 Tax=Demequina sp. NBRC 110053 TaxID=1570342 RepID=UPI001184CDC3|nr:FHA domain-containing protein [Demequina sp. NBRC 110053]
MTGVAPVVAAAALVAVVLAGVWIWMALALGALLDKLHARPGLAWVPVARWVEAARAARMHPAPVAVARSVGLLGFVALAAGLLIALASTTADEAASRLLLVGGGIAYGLGSLVGWILWIYGAGTIEMRLRAPAALSWLAAISPVIWASVMGWGRYGRPGPAVGVADARVVDERSAPPPAADGVSDPQEPDPVTAPMQGLWAQVDWPDAARADDANTAGGGAVMDIDPGSAADSARGGDPHSRESEAWREAQAAIDASTRSEREAEAASHAEHEPYTGPVSPYANAAPTPPEAAPAPDLGGEPSPFDTPIPATAELQEIPWMAPAPRPPSAHTPADPAPAHHAPSHEPSAADPAAPRPKPNPWDFVHEDPPPATPASPVGASAPAETPAPLPRRQPPTPPEPASASAVPGDVAIPGQHSADATPRPAPDTDPPPHLPPSSDRVSVSARASASAPETASPAAAAPPSPWAPVERKAPSEPTAPMTAPTPRDTGDAEDADDHTVMVQRGRPTWMLETADGVRYALRDERITIGRAASRITAGVTGIQDQTRTMSKVHAELTLVDGRWHARDLGSTNGTYVRVDGTERQVPQESASAVDGDLLLGDLVARIVLAEEVAR